MFVSILWHGVLVQDADGKLQGVPELQQDCEIKNHVGRKQWETTTVAKKSTQIYTLNYQSVA